MAPISDAQIADLRSILPHLYIVIPDSPEYDEATSRWNAMAESKAGAVVFPTAAEETSQLLAFSHANSLDIAVKAGGHGNRGSSPTNGGLCIDLSRIALVSVDPVSKRITAGGGALWSHVYAEAEKYDLAAVGGISPGVGVGGLALHGGYGWLTSAHGLAVDNIVEIQIALADGSLVRASDTINEDLFWAMRGAGSAFGAVTEFVLQGHEQKDWVWSGNLVFGKQNLGTVLRVCKEVLARENHGEAALCWGWNVLPRGTEPVIFAVPWYNGSEQEAKEFFAPLLDLKSMVNTTKMVPFSASGAASSSAPGRNLRKCGHGSSVMVPLDPVYFESMFNDFVDFLKMVPDAGKSIVVFEVYNPYPTMQVGQTTTAFSDRGRQINVQVVPTWTKKENDDVCRGWCRNLSRKMADEFERRKGDKDVDEVTKKSVGIYPNYDGKLSNVCSMNVNSQLKGFGLSPKQLYGVNYERLVELKEKYDPDNLFRKFVNFDAVK